MPTLTTNYSLSKPLVNNATDQDLWGGYLNDGLDTIDTKLKLGIDRVKRVITTTDSVVAGDRKKILLCDATAAAFTLTMIAAATAADGFEVTIVKTDASANAVTIDGSGAELIGAAATFSLSGRGDSATLVSDGSNWNFTGNKTTPSAVASASTTAEGIIEIATTAEVQAGASSTLAVTPASMYAALGFKTYYESAETLYADQTLITLSHGLGLLPRKVTAELVCKTTDLGWAVDDRIPLSLDQGASTALSFTLGYNTTQILAICGSAGIRVGNKSTGTGAAITPASWRLVFRAWA